MIQINNMIHNIQSLFYTDYVCNRYLSFVEQKHVLFLRIFYYNYTYMTRRVGLGIVCMASI